MTDVRPAPQPWTDEQKTTICSDDVDLSYDGGLPSVGWTVGGVWLEYTVELEPGVYDLRLCASSEGGGVVDVSLDAQQLGSIAISDTGSWSIFRDFDLPDVAVASGGSQVLRLSYRGSGPLFELRSLEFIDRATLADPGVGPGDPVRVTIDWDSLERR